MTVNGGTYRTGRERVERILDAAHDLFLRNGYRATSLRDIAAEAGISHPALLRYFPTRADVLTALVERLDARSGAVWQSRWESGIAVPAASTIAHGGDDVQGWIPLFTALLGEATSPDHPGHKLMLDRRVEGRRLGVSVLRDAGADADAADREITELVAGWDGLQILSLYFPGEIDIPSLLELHESTAFEAVADDARAVGEAGSGADAPTTRADWPPVVSAAARLYARTGYYETSMQAVADEAGMTRAALIHVAPTKQALLDLVLAHLYDEPPGRPWTARASDVPRWQIAAEIVLLCEATVPAHPAHDALTDRLAAARAGVTDDLARRGGDHPADLADWLIATTIGALIAWLYEPDVVDPHVVVERASDRLLHGVPRP